MTQTFTPNLDTVRYLFNETSPKENEAVEQFLAFNTDELDFYLDSLFISKQISKIKIKPKDATIQSILNYSKSFEPAV
jgi:hypothetical protein